MEPTLGELLTELEALGQRIGAAIDGAAAADLLALLAEKTRLTERANVQWPPGGLPVELEPLLGRIRETDALNLTALRHRLQTTEAKLTALREAYERSLSYRVNAAEVSRRARFLDRRG